ncbi:MAG: hypothetical protein CMH83_18930 [Nocardioides sp.]|nr:hypothetical protein [Nocardioides sp.]
MNAMSNVERETSSGALTIGDLAERTGVSTGTLRMWETRYGFPVPQRRASGHRRYDEQVVDLVRDVVRRREQGVRLEVAIDQAQQAVRVDEPDDDVQSIFGRLRDTHPQLQPQRLTKSTLLGLSWAIEDEFAVRSVRAHVFGAFQREEHFDSALDRWTDLAATTTSTWAFADFAPEVASTTMPRRVSLSTGHPMRREWAVVCDGPDLPVAMTALELPGQRRVADRDRIFEAVWTVDPVAVREASRVCAKVAVGARVHGARDLVRELSEPARTGEVDLNRVTSLFNRVVGYVDGAGHRRA